MERKRFRCFILAFLSAFFFLPALVACALEDSKTIRFTISIDEPTGVDRILYAALERMGYSVTFETMGMSSAIQLADSGEKDGLYAQAPGLEGKFPNLVMVPERVSDVKFEAFARKSTFGIAIRSWEDFKGLRVGTIFQKPYIHNHLPKNIAELVQKESVPLLLQALVDGECDVIVMTNSLEFDVLVPGTLKKVGLADKTEAYPYLNKKYAHLVPELARTIRDMKKDGTFGRIARQERGGTPEKTILHMASFYADMAAEKDLAEGIGGTLARDLKAQIYTVYLNANRIPDDEGRAKSVFTPLRASMLKNPPDVVIVSGRSALNFMFDYYSRFFTQTPVVFCGVGDLDLRELWKLEDNATGVIEMPSAYETVALMLKLFPDTKKLFVVNDYRETGRGWKKVIDHQLEPFAEIVDITHNENVPFSELLETIGKLPRDTLVLMGFYYVDGSDILYSDENLGERIGEAARVPVFGLAGASIGHGQVGGKYTDGRKQGSAVAEKVLSILDGTPAKSIGIQIDMGGLNRWIFDDHVLRRWGIRAEQLPEDAEVINRPLSLREANPTAYRLLMSLVVAAILIIAGLSVFMFIMRKRNRELALAQKNLYTAKDRLERALESAPLAYMLFVGDRIVEANSYLLDNLDIATGSENEMRMKDPDMAENLAGIMRSDTSAYGSILQFGMKNGDLHRFHVNLASVAVWGGERGIVFWGIDIEERERHRDSLARMQEELQKLIDTVPIPIFICTPNDYRIMYANGSFLEKFGFATREDALGVSMRIFHPEKQPDGDDSEATIGEYAQRAMTAGMPVSIRWRYEKPDGNEMFAYVTSSFVVYKETDCLVVTIWDMTAEHERENLVVQAARKEREANQMKSLFLMNMSHEIRTPMNAIIGFSQLALHARQTPDNAELFKKINVSAKNLLNIINDILDFSKIEAEKLDLLTEEFEMEEVVSNAFMVASERIENKKIEMLVDMDPEIPCRVLGDKTRVWQVLKNLLDNAAKYTEKGRVVLHVGARSEGLDEGDVLFRFVVEDTGLGMTEEQLQRIFAPFEQFHNNAKNNLTGTGLGMSITKQLVELMGGGITIESRVGEGTRVMVLLTLRKAEGTVSLREHLGSDGLDVEQVLIADDDEYARQIMSSLLESSGISAVCVSSGAEVFEKVREYKEKGHPFKIVILDYLLGEDNGVEIAKELHATTSKQTKLLMVSAYSKWLRPQEIDEAGFKDVIEKPFIPSVFIGKLKRAMHTELKADRTKSYLQFSGAKILLCEDNVFNQDVAKGMLGVFGIVPTVAEDGREALDMLEQDEFHMVFMDIMMPFMDGHEATVAIRGSGRPYANIPIVAMTANVMQDEVERCRREGMNGHIGKPMEMQQVYESLLANLPREIVDAAVPAAAAEPSGEESFAIEGVDMAAGIARFAGKREKYLDALRRFASTLGDELLPWPQAAAPEERDHTKRIVHTLKGVSGNLGITVLFDEAVAFEREFLERTETEERYSRFVERCRIVRERIATLLGPVREEKPARRKGSVDELRALVGRMHEAFESSQVDLCDALLKEAAEVDWTVGDERMRTVVKAMEEYDFEEALGLLDDPEGEA